MRRSIMIILGLVIACDSGISTQAASVPLPTSLADRCREVAGEPQVVEIGKKVLVAIGYDLANTILIRTSSGNVIVDAMSSPSRAAAARRALEAKAPGPVRALIYTHSHLDHVGGASAWVDGNTEILAGAPFTQTFVSRYGTLQRSERARAARQHGHLLEDHDLPCSSIGKRLDFTGDIGEGARLPTREISGTETLTIGDTRMVLISAPGETDDQIYVHLPDEEILLVGDNYYAAFPNLYTIRGTLGRKAEPWMASLDLIRRLAPKTLVPSHTLPVLGQAEILKRVTSYRDAIAWIRAAVVRGANAGASLDEVVAAAALPPHLARLPWLAPLYGEVEWSARAFYGQAIGWFDGRASQLYPLSEQERFTEDLALMGGEEAVLKRLDELIKAGKDRYVLDLLDRLQAVSGGDRSAMQASLMKKLAARTENSNARAYLLVRARELQGHQSSPKAKPVNEALVKQLPIESFFESMAFRVKPKASAGVEQTLKIDLVDVGRRFFVTVRHGVAEVTEELLPGQPAPIGSIVTDQATWKGLALKQRNQAAALVSGDLKVESPVAVAKFLSYFDTTL